jgi:hypothetical protein
MQEKKQLFSKIEQFCSKIDKYILYLATYSYP